MAQKQSYKAKLEIERLNDGMYKVYVALSGGNVETMGFTDREELLEKLDKFKQQLKAFERDLDGPGPDGNP